MLEYLGSGKNAKIYKAELDDGTIVAIKQNSFLYNNRRVEKFNSECSILKSLSHTNVVDYLFRQDHLLCTEIMDGDLSIEYYHPYFNSHACILDIARGVNYIHTIDTPIIHRDLKVENMLVIKEGGVVRQTKIGDFGYAVIARPSINDQMPVFLDVDKTGTPLYMACEIVEPEEKEMITYSTASDMWAFGIICWHLLTKGFIYPHITTIRGYRNYIVNGGRANFQGTHGDKKLFEMIERCWNQDQFLRPTALDFVKYFDGKINTIATETPQLE